MPAVPIRCGDVVCRRVEVCRRHGVALQQALAVDSCPCQNADAVADRRHIFVLRDEVVDELIDSIANRHRAVVVRVRVRPREGILVLRRAPAADEHDG